MKYKLLAVVMGLSLSAFMVLQPVFSAGGNYGPVKAGDNLWTIATKMRTDNSVSIQQMMLAIRDKNPQAFLSGNINSLEKGFYLYPPTLEEVRQRSHTEAVQQVQTENREWKDVGRFSPRGRSLIVPAPDAKAQADLQAARQEQSRLSAEISGLREKFEQEQRRSAELEEQLKQLQLYRTSQQQGSAEAKASEAQVKQLQTEITSLKQVLAEKDARIEQLETAAKQVAAAPAPAVGEEVAKLKAELADAKQLLEQRDTHIQNLQASLREASITIKRQFAESKELHARLKELEPGIAATEPEEPAQPGSGAQPSLTLEAGEEEQPAEPPVAVFTDQVKPAEPAATNAGGNSDGEAIPLKNILQQQAANGAEKTGLGQLPQPSRISIIVALVSTLFILALLWRSFSQQRALRKEEARLRASLANGDLRKGPDVNISAAS